MVSVGTEMRLWLGEESHRSVRMVLQSRVTEIGGVSVARLVKVPPYSTIVVDGDRVYALLAQKNGNMEGTSVMDTVRYHIHFAKKRCSLQKAARFLPNFKPQPLKPLSAGTEKRPRFSLEETYSYILRAKRDETEDSAALRQSSGAGGEAPAASAGFSRQRASKATEQPPARIFRAE